MNEIYGLYCVCDTCKERQEWIRYVGQTIRGSEVRFRFHRYDALAENYVKKSGLRVYRWMRKHGVGNIRFKVLETGLEECDLDPREEYWIKALETFSGDNPSGLNLSRGGKSVRGYKHSPETREKMKGRAYTQETRDKMSASAKARGSDHLKPFHGMFKGEKSSNATITNEVATQIKSDLWDGAGIKETAEKFGVGQNVVNHLLQGRTWVDTPWPSDRERTPSTAHRRSAQKRVGVPLADITKRKLSERVSKAWNDPDRRERGSKASSGENNAMSKLSESDVRYIRRESEAGRSYTDISREMGVSSGCISKVARKISWKHVK